MAVKRINLDKLSAEMGFELANEHKNDAKEFERTVTKALGILIEDGLLAYSIWLEKEGELKIIDKSFKLLKSAGIIKDENSSKDKLRKAALIISENIDTTLLARQLLERMLVYARYRAKALQKGD